VNLKSRRETKGKLKKGKVYNNVNLEELDAITDDFLTKKIEPVANDPQPA
jgi:hypothetical protein